MISEFRGEYHFLSNFSPSPIVYRGLIFPTVEHAFQATKCRNDDEESILRIRNAKTPRDAKSLGRRIKLREDWEEIKLAVMEELIRIKFRNPQLREKLLATGDEELCEGNHWRDEYWGVDIFTGRGQNHLGIILMKVRSAVAQRS